MKQEEDAPPFHLRTGLAFRTKIMLSTFAAVCLGILLTAITFILVDVSATRDLIEENLLAQTESLAHNVEAAIDFDDVAAVNEDLERLRDQPHILRAAVYKAQLTDTGGQRQELFAKYRRDDEDAPFPEVTNPSLESWQESSTWCIRPVKHERSAIGAVFLERELADLDTKINQYASTAFGVLAVGSLLTIIGALRFQRILTLPVLELTKVAGKVAATKKYDVRANKLSHDELGDLTDVFNDMLSTVGDAHRILRESNEEMEARVDERTRELSLANEKLVGEMKERERAEKELLDAHRRLIRQEKLVTVGHLSANVAHELRNPLGAVRQSLYFLRKKGEEVAPDKLRKHLDVIGSELSRADEVIDGLLDLTRDASIKKTHLDLATLVEEVVHYCRLPKNIHFDTDFSSVPFVIYADPTLLRQVFVNLVTNAQQAMPQGGQLTVKGMKNEEGMATILISDTGHGIESAELPKIFDVLYTTKSTGIGLGLSLCRDILQRHEGSIRMESSLSKGTTAILTLPEAKNDSKERKEAAALAETEK